MHRSGGMYIDIYVQGCTYVCTMTDKYMCMHILPVCAYVQNMSLLQEKLCPLQVGHTHAHRQQWVIVKAMIRQIQISQ